MFLEAMASERASFVSVQVLPGMFDHPERRAWSPGAERLSGGSSSQQGFVVVVHFDHYYIPST